MKSFNSLLAAMAVYAAGIISAQAAEENFASLTSGQTRDKVRKSGLLQSNTDHLNADGIIAKEATWGVRLGMTTLTQDSPGASRDTDYGYAVGLQAGVMQAITDNASMELGYRYLRTNAETEVAASGGPKEGTLRLTSSAQTYLAATYTF